MVPRIHASLIDCLVLSIVSIWILYLTTLMCRNLCKKSLFKILEKIINSVVLQILFHKPKV